ncbi:nitroreductase [Bernardetia sp.]|uniref:nitroreductase family protein n=1 Tax=Bernardetia sp. TaxID=1937974 RepID=UPI0025BD3395|nr:nitroreductase [Bernardetia sp.]
MKYNIKEITDITPEQINQLIRDRRTIYPHECTGEKIDDKIVWQLLENVTWSPNHGKLEPWRFFVFADEKREELGDFLINLYKKTTPEQEYKEEKAIKLRKRMSQSSHIVVVVARTNQNPRIPAIEDIEAVACGIQNMQLSAAVYGLASYWGTGALVYADETHTQFGLSENEKIVGFLYLGVPKEDLVKEATRKPIQEKVEWIK